MRVQSQAPVIREPLIKNWVIAPELVAKNQVIEEILRYIKDNGVVSPSNLFRYRLCLDEAITNSITHGCRGLEQALVRIEFYWSASSWAVRIKDPGTGFDVGKVPDPTAPGQEFQEHGRGILIMDRYCKELVYSHGGREVTMYLLPDGVKVS